MWRQKLHKRGMSEQQITFSCSSGFDHLLSRCTAKIYSTFYKWLLSEWNYYLVLMIKVFTHFAYKLKFDIAQESLPPCLSHTLIEPLEGDSKCTNKGVRNGILNFIKYTASHPFLLNNTNFQWQQKSPVALLWLEPICWCDTSDMQTVI